MAKYTAKFTTINAMRWPGPDHTKYLRPWLTEHGIDTSYWSFLDGAIEVRSSREVPTTVLLPGEWVCVTPDGFLLLMPDAEFNWCYGPARQ